MDTNPPTNKNNNFLLNATFTLAWYSSIDFITPALVLASHLFSPSGTLPMNCLASSNNQVIFLTTGFSSMP